MFTLFFVTSIVQQIQSSINRRLVRIIYVTLVTSSERFVTLCSNKLFLLCRRTHLFLQVLNRFPKSLTYCKRRFFLCFWDPWRVLKTLCKPVWSWTYVSLSFSPFFFCQNYLRKEKKKYLKQRGRFSSEKSTPQVLFGFWRSKLFWC